MARIVVRGEFVHIGHFTKRRDQLTDDEAMELFEQENPVGFARLAENPTKEAVSDAIYATKHKGMFDAMASN